MAGGAGLGGALLIAGASRPVFGQEATPEIATEHAAHDDPAESGLIPGPSPWESEELVEPEVRRAENGVLETQLHVQYAYAQTGGYNLYMRTYDGTIPGPTLRLQPGDTLKIALTNGLPPTRDEDPLDEDLPHHLNIINFHFHGSHVSPEGISDNIFRRMEPGQRYEIEIDLPADHTQGTYWYHPHHHGGADVQIASGMAGALIVEGDFASASRSSASARARCSAGASSTPATRTTSSSHWMAIPCCRSPATALPCPKSAARRRSRNRPATVRAIPRPSSSPPGSASTCWCKPGAGRIPAPGAALLPGLRRADRATRQGDRRGRTAADGAPGDSPARAAADDSG